LTAEADLDHHRRGTTTDLVLGTIPTTSAASLIPILFHALTNKTTPATHIILVTIIIISSSNTTTTILVIHNSSITTATLTTQTTANLATSINNIQKSAIAPTRAQNPRADPLPLSHRRHRKMPSLTSQSSHLWTRRS
jgi:hypothetical protein